MDSGLPLIGTATFAAFVAGFMTLIGAVPICFFPKVNDKTLDILLGASAGVMLAATCFSLLLPALELMQHSAAGAALISIGFLFGGATLIFTDKLIPHQHFLKGPEGPSSSLRKIWLFVFAITIHNFPEGLAVGVSFGDGNLNHGIKMAIAIGLQNMPEGLAVALALLREKYSLPYAMWIVFLSGMVEPVGGFLGISIVTLAKIILPWGLAFAAGAMLWVISNEIIPETHRKGYEKYATSGLLIGFAVMMILDNTQLV